jgi:hypothetical protein
MNWKDLLEDGYNRIPAYAEHILNGLAHEDLTWQPHKESNSIGWLVWHLARQMDAQAAALAGQEQLWIKEGWHQKFRRPDDPTDFGFGDTPEDAAAFHPPAKEVMLEYLEHVVDMAVKYFKGLTEKDLDRKLNEPQFQPPPSVGVRLISILDDCIIHAGQAAYVRGLRQGKGWQEY